MHKGWLSVIQSLFAVQAGVSETQNVRGEKR